MKKVIIIFVIVLGQFICNAQNWKSGIGILGENVKDIIEYNLDTLLAGVDNNGIFVSYDNGNSWTQFALKGESVISLIKMGKSIIAGTVGNDIYRTNSIFSIWNRVAINNLVVNQLKLQNNDVYACTWGISGPGGVYRSSDMGISWQKCNLTQPYTVLTIDFNASGRSYVATPDGTYFSDSQSSWIKTIGTWGTNWTVNYIGKDSIIYGNEIDGIFLSKDNGVSAQQSNISARRTFFIDHTIYATSRDELMYSSSLSGNWVNMKLNKNVNSLIKIQNKLFAATTEGVYVYDDSMTKTIGVESNAITIFPNPTLGLFEVQGLEYGKFSFEILNSKGQIVLQSQSLRNDISGVKPGIYLVKITYPNTSIIKKIVKI